MTPTKSPRSTEALVFWCLAALLFACGAYVRFRLPLTPIGDNDVASSLDPVLSVMKGTGFHREPDTSNLYSGFLLVFLSVIPDLRAVTVLQHALGLVGGGLLLIAWDRLRFFLLKPLVPGWLHRLLALALLLVYLFSSNRILYEHRLRSEALVGFVSIANFLAVLEFVRLRFYDRSRWSPLPGSLFIVTGYVLCGLRPSYLLTEALLAIPLLVSLFGRQEPWPRKVLATVPGLVVAALLWLPDYLYVQSTKWVQEFVPATLFTVHADLIADQMQADLAEPKRVPWDPATLDAIHTRLREEIERSRKVTPWPVLNFNPDYLLFTDSICSYLHEPFHTAEKRTRFELYYFARAWKKRPGAMLHRVAEELQLFYSPAGAYKEPKKVADLGKLYAGSITGFTAHPKFVYDSPIGREYIEQCGKLSSLTWPLDQPWLIQQLIVLLGYAYVPIFAVSLALFVCWVLWRPFRQHFRAFGPLVFLAYAYNLGNALSIAVVHSLVVSRYTKSQFTMTLFAEMAGLLFLLEAAVWIVTRVRTTASPEPPVAQIKRGP